ncbi:MAG: cation:proton antiporter, partial [Kiritimatiellae bacterium]|nr:cation:proton antiporter [Kiritimatiellia bacterium]
MRKATLSLLVVFAAVFAVAGELPATAADWPEKLGMTPKMLFLVLQIGIIIFAAKIGGTIAGMMRLPSVLGELGAGILIGPWALGGIPIPGFDGMFQHGLFYGHALRAQVGAGGNPFAVTPELYGICTIASVVLLFLSGIETNLKMFLKYAFAGSLVGVGGVVFSFLLGDLCAVYATTFLPDLLGGIECLARLGELVKAGEITKAILSPAAMFMGIMSTATSVGITARILSEKKKMDSAEGVTIMAGAVIDDVLGIIVLAIGMGIIGSQSVAAAAGEASRGVDWGSIGMTAVKAFGVWLVGTVVGVVFARRISWLLKLFKAHGAIATLAFGLALVIAGVFEALGLTLIIGAYVMGLALSRTDIKHLVQENLATLYTFLVPIFFCVMGMMVDVTALCSKPVLVFGGIYTALAVLAKVVGCAIPSIFCGFNLLGALRVGAGMIPRGEVALIIAGIGLSNGYLTQEVFGIGILMTLATTVVAPPALVGLFVPKAKGVRRPSAAADAGREVVFELETREVAELVVGRLVEEFRKEGFFVTLLSQTDHIWEIAMDDIDMSVRRLGKKIRFTCTSAEETIVMTAWMEVASQMNDLARAIAKPIRKEDVGRMIAASEPSARGSEGVGRYLQGFVMLPKFRATSKKEAIQKMVAEIAASCPNHVTNAAEAVEAVLRREASMTTGLDHGIAVP